MSWGGPPEGVDAVTHLLAGRLIAAGLGGGALGWLATAFAVLPDVDTVSWAFPRLQKWIRHRGLTHTLPFGALSALAAAGLFAALGWAPFGVAFLVAFGAWGSHVALDVLNWGAPVLAPWRRGRVEFTVHGGFAWSAGVAAALNVLLAVLALTAPPVAAVAAGVVAAAYVLYFGVRIAAKIHARSRHPGRRLVPTWNPLVWVAV